jgi:penicillin-insensitive murein endopeptidase
MTPPPLPRRWLRYFAWVVAVLGLGVVAAVVVAPSAPAEPSRCLGRVADGRIENAVALPLAGKNFSAYTSLARALRRNYVHDRVHRVVLAAYARLEHTQPGQHFVYAETGGPQGGPFRPHRTHQNGLSVDFHVPVRDADGRVAALPLHAANRFGYDLDFDAEGRLDGLRIDFNAINAHLLALQDAAADEGIGIAQVIFEPAYLPALYAAEGGPEVRRRVHFLPRPAWVRHDEHYHVDFAVRCDAMR